MARSNKRTREKRARGNADLVSMFGVDPGDPRAGSPGLSKPDEGRRGFSARRRTNEAEGRVSYHDTVVSRGVGDKIPYARSEDGTSTDLTAGPGGSHRDPFGPVGGFARTTSKKKTRSIIDLVNIRRPTGRNEERHRCLRHHYLLI